MAKKEKAVVNKIVMTELEEKPTAHVERAKVALEKKAKKTEEKKKANPIIDRIIVIKTRAQKNKIPWAIELEKKMEASTTIGQVKRLWRDYIRAHDQKATV